MKCLEIARLQDFAPNTPDPLPRGARFAMLVDEPPSENSCLRACITSCKCMCFTPISGSKRKGGGRWDGGVMFGIGEKGVVVVIWRLFNL